MKRLVAFSRSFPFIHQLDRNTSLSASNTHRRSNSNNSSGSSNSTKTSQTFQATRIDGGKLRDLLNRNFGENYSLSLQFDEFTVVAEKELTELELMSCRIPRRVP
ncbi:hypothetical protein GGR51DRAFT_520414 [Nemania sp. FL0031]|nr:hypothetical protein GGR51DRAFT_520414 [Nemania sp. FL0031]